MKKTVVIRATDSDLNITLDPLSEHRSIDVKLIPHDKSMGGPVILEDIDFAAAYAAARTTQEYLEALRVPQGSHAEPSIAIATLISAVIQKAMHVLKQPNEEKKGGDEHA